MSATPSSPQISISAFIISFNEEKNIGRCIASLKKIAAEIIVVDSFSEDNTVAIAESLGAKVIQRPFNGYGEQKLFAQNQTLHDWVLSIDADEVLSPELEKSILLLAEPMLFAAYHVNILTNYCGKWIRHCGWYPQSKIRLWNKKKGSMTADKVHEGIVLHDKNAAEGLLKGDVFHYSYNTISDHIRKIEHYSEIGARFDVERGKKCSLIKLLIAPRLQFISDFIFHRGFLDGYYGYIVCKNSSFASFVKYAKIRQYTQLKKNGLPY